MIVALANQHAMRMRSIVTCDLPHYNIFPHYLINGTIFGGGGEVFDHFDFLYNFCLKYISF